MDDPVNDAIEATLETLRDHTGLSLLGGREALKEVYEELIKELTKRLDELNHG